MGMRTIIESIPAHVIGFIEKLRQQLYDVQFSARHRVRPEDFTRQRQLTFPIVMLFVLQKTVKSIQRHLHDLLNRIGLDGRLESSRLGEVELAIKQLPLGQPGDVLVNDRGFTGYAYLAWHHHLALDYISRCSSGSFAAAQELFRMNRAGRSKTVRLLGPADQRAQLRGLGLPLELTVRFVSVRLPSGELEFLATSLL